MVTEKKRVRAYNPRGPHKEGCLCVVCKAKRPAGPPPAPAIEEPLLKVVRLDSLPVKARFIRDRQEHMVKEHVEGMVVCYNLSVQDSMTLGGATVVEPIK